MGGGGRALLDKGRRGGGEAKGIETKKKKKIEKVYFDHPTYVPRRKSTGFCEMTQCPALTSTTLKSGKKRPTTGRTSSGTYLLSEPRTNKAAPLYGRTEDPSSGSL